MRLASIIVVVFLLAPLTITPVRQLIFIHRSAVVPQLDEEHEKLAVLNFTQSEFQALKMEKKGKEFLWQGYLYDIKSIEISEGTVRVLALRDDPESALFQAFHAIQEGQSTLPAGKTGLVFMPYFHDLPAGPVLDICGVADVTYPFDTFRLTEEVLKVAVPPPELLIL
jgi:hypothetical protein